MWRWKENCWIDLSYYTSSSCQPDDRYWYHGQEHEEVRGTIWETAFLHQQQINLAWSWSFKVNIPIFCSATIWKRIVQAFVKSMKTLHWRGMKKYWTFHCYYASSNFAASLKMKMHAMAKNMSYSREHCYYTNCSAVAALRVKIHAMVKVKRGKKNYWRDHCYYTSSRLAASLMMKMHAMAYN